MLSELPAAVETLDLSSTVLKMRHSAGSVVARRLRSTLYDRCEVLVPGLREPRAPVYVFLGSFY